MKTVVFLLALMVAVMLAFSGCTSDNGTSVSGPGTSDLSGSWYWQNPLPRGNDLNDVVLTDQMIGWAVGDAGTILRTSDGGITWIPQSSSTIIDLRQVCFSEHNRVWAVGYTALDNRYPFPGRSDGVIVSTADGGSHWTARPEPNMALSAVAFASATTGWAGGYSGITGQTVVLHTTDGGSSWESQTFSALESIVGLAALDEHTVLAALGGTTDTGRIFRTSDGGSTWSEQYSSRNYGYVDLAFSDSVTGWAVAKYPWYVESLSYTTDGGVHWTSGGIVGINDYVHAVIAYPTLNKVALVCDSTIYFSSDTGATWSATPLSARLLSATIRLDQGCAVGTFGSILSSADAGANWIARDQAVTREDLLDVDVLPDGVHGWAVGDNGMVLRTVDEGGTWTIQQSGTARQLLAVDFLDASSGWVVGGMNTWDYGSSLLHTVDGGSSWDVRIMDGVQRLSDVAFTSATQGWLVGLYGTLLHTTDGGANWALVDAGTSGDLMSIGFRDNGQGWIVGGSGYSGGSVILTTRDRGTTWTHVVLPGVGPLYDGCFVDDSLGWAVGEAGLVVRTIDGGAHWTIVTSGAQFNLRKVVFADAYHGWTCGDNGEMLSTSDGGENWENESATSNVLYGLDYVSEHDLWAVGAGGTILHHTRIQIVPF